MENVESVKQLDETGLRWVAKIAGKTVEWDAEISEQVPDKRIVWYGANGPVRNGMVSFNPINADITRVTLRIGYEPEGFIEQAGDKLGILSNRCKAISSASRNSSKRAAERPAPDAVRFSLA